MRLSIITPCSRPSNLPIIYDSIIINRHFFKEGIEWIIVYDNEKVDERILSYIDKKFIDIKLYTYKREEGDPYASYMRNVGLKYVTGDYIYYLDDDNIIHENFYENVINYMEFDKILIFNQFNKRLNTARHKSIFSIDMITPGGIDTGQFVIPKKYKHIKWVNGGEYNDETPYLLELIKNVGENKLKWVNLVYTYRNFLRIDSKIK